MGGPGFHQTYLARPFSTEQEKRTRSRITDSMLLRTISTDTTLQLVKVLTNLILIPKKKRLLARMTKTNLRRAEKGKEQPAPSTRRCRCNRASQVQVFYRFKVLCSY